MQLNDYREGIKLYNSQNMSNQLVKDNFVVRKRQFENVWRDISEARMEFPEQHYIIQGVRGSGKTTLLNRLAIEIKESEELQKRLIAVVMKEEEYGISTLFRLWERVAEELYETNPSDFLEILEEFDELEQADPKRAIALLINQLKKADKKIVLFIDNLVELFEHFSPLENEHLREILTTNCHVRIIGGSAISLESFYDNSSPFYQFFRVIKLQGLNKKETITLLKKLAEYEGEQETLKNILKNDPGKIESIRRLTGGIPRTISILFSVLMEGPKGTTFAMLEDTIDKTTPLYKHRMDDLSKQQKPIIDAIALNWDAISAKEIKERTRLESKLISAQLNQLEKQWLIEKIDTDGKNKLYRLKERFFNIWYLMRYGRRKDRRRVKWLTQFMEIWCSKDDLKNRSQLFVEQLNEGGHPKAALWFANAMLCSEHLGVLDKYEVREKTEGYLINSGSKSYLPELLPVFDQQNKNDALGELEKLLEVETFLALSDTQRTSLWNALQNTDYLHGQCLFYLFSGKPERIDAIAKDLPEESGNAYSRLTEFIAKCAESDFKNAETAYSRMHDVMPGWFYWVVSLGLIYPKIIEFFETIVDSIESKYRLYLFKWLIEHEQLQQAERLVKSVIAINSTEAYECATFFHMKTQSHLDVIDCVQQAINANKATPKSLKWLAYAYYCTNKNQEALDIVEHYQITEEKGVEALYGEILSNLNQFDAAIVQFKKALENHNIKLFNASIAYCYLNQNKIELAEKHYSVAYSGGVIGLAMLLHFYVQVGNKTLLRKAESLIAEALVVESPDKIANIIDCSAAVQLLLLMNNFNLAQQVTQNFLQVQIAKGEETNNIEEIEHELTNIFVHFLAKGQTNLVDRWLREFALQERFKPLYFALMHLMKDTYPNEYLRMGEELRETVEEILQRIKTTADSYQNKRLS